MGRWLVKLGDRYLEWSSIVDAPISMLMTDEELAAYWRERYGTEGLERLATVKAGAPGAESIGWNRAGPNETRLSVEEIIERYDPRTTKAENNE